MTAPLVSVLVTSYNHAPYVEQALDSVLAQEFEDYELIITDDCSQDDTVAVIRGWLARTGAKADVDAQPRNLGICPTRNRALARSRGRFVCSLSGDDWFEPDRLSRQSAYLLAQDDDVAAVYSDARVVNADGTQRSASYLAATYADGRRPQGWVFDDLHRSCFVPAMSVMTRRAAIDAVGGYDEDLAFEDWDMWLRLADRYRFGWLDMIAANRRDLATSVSNAGFARAHYQESIIRLHEKWLDRDPTSRAVSAAWIRRAALVVAAEDRRTARAALTRVDDVPTADRRRWRALSWALAVPGSGALVQPGRRAAAAARTAVGAERGAWRAGRRGALAARIAAR